MAFVSINDRICAYLQRRLTEQGDNEVQVTHQEIANTLGTAREVVTRALKGLENRGMVQLSRGVITVDFMPGRIKNS